jgi:hypothetical protein
MSNEKFKQIIMDFKKDLLATFPELATSLNELDVELCYAHCSETYPKIFFELLYENDSLFEKECLLLPNINFSLLMKDESISEKTKKTIWKYLQLLLFSILDTMNNGENFGETSKLFESVKEDDLHKKIAETMEEMKDFFVDETAEDTDDPSSNNFMDPDKLKGHLDGLMGGKIGSLAKEIAEETAKSIGDQDEFMKNIMKNPKEILSLVKDIGGKLEEKIKSGNLKESELLQEASEIIDKMKDIPGIKQMMSKMGMNGKMDFKGMANKMQQNLKQTKTKERLNKKREERQAQGQAQAQGQNEVHTQTQTHTHTKTKTQTKTQTHTQTQSEKQKATVTKQTEDTFVVKVGDSTPMKTTRPKRKKKKSKASDTTTTTTTE